MSAEAKPDEQTVNATTRVWVRIDRIINPATGQWVRLPRPLAPGNSDLDSFIAGYQHRLADEWFEQYPDAVNESPSLPADSSGKHRGHALALATRLHCARAERAPRLGDGFGDVAVLETAERFAAYLRGGSDG